MVNEVKVDSFGYYRLILKFMALFHPNSDNKLVQNEQTHGKMLFIFGIMYKTNFTEGQ